MQIDFLGIEAFLAVAECGSFGLAAERLHLSQTAISHRMRKLEESLGVRLMVRTTRGIALTEAGDALLPKARAALLQLEASCETVRAHGQHVGQWVAFSCLPTLSATTMVPLLQRFEAAQPGVLVRVFDSTPNEILELVEAGTAAFGLTVSRAPLPRLDVEVVGEEDFVLACPHGHPLAGGAPVEWPQLLGQPLIRISLPSGNSMTIDDAIGELREQLTWRHETQRNASALDLVRAGMGLTVVPRLSVPPEAGVVVVPLRSPTTRRTLIAVRRRDAALAEREILLYREALALLRERLAAG